jgi:hypothetical protein
MPSYFLLNIEMMSHYYKLSKHWWTRPPHFLHSTLFSLSPKEACVASAKHLTCTAAPLMQCFFFFPFPLASVWCSCYISLCTDFVSSTLEQVQLPTLDFCQCRAIPLIGFTSVVPTACPSPLRSSELRGLPMHILLRFAKRCPTWTRIVWMQPLMT